MKTYAHSLCILAALTIFATGTVFAHPGGHAPAPTKPPVATVVLPATMGETVAAIKSQLALLKIAQKDGKFSAVSANAVTLNQLVQHIVDQVPADKKVNVQKIAEKHATITAELTLAAAAGAAKPVSDLVSKLGDNLGALLVLAR